MVNRFNPKMKGQFTEDLLERFNEDRRKAELLDQLALKYGLHHLSEAELLARFDKILGDTQSALLMTKWQAGTIAAFSGENVCFLMSLKQRWTPPLPPWGEAKSQEALAALSGLDEESLLNLKSARRSKWLSPEPWRNLTPCAPMPWG